MKDSKFNFILELHKLKEVYRNNKTASGRNESTAEHSWSLTMIFQILRDDLVEELGDFDTNKVYELCLAHDLVEIYAGDANLYDEKKRQQVEESEKELIKKFAEIDDKLGKKVESLWLEFEAGGTLESKIAVACDKLDPLFLRIQAKDSLKAQGVDEATVDKKKQQYFSFSKTFSSYFEKIKEEMKKEGLL